MEASELRQAPVVRTELRSKRTANWWRLVTMVLPLLLVLAGCDVRNLARLAAQQVSNTTTPMVFDLDVKITARWAAGSGGSPQAVTPNTNSRTEQQQHTGAPHKQGAKPAKHTAKPAQRKVCNPRAARRR